MEKKLKEKLKKICLWLAAGIFQSIKAKILYNIKTMMEVLNTIIFSQKK